MSKFKDITFKCGHTCNMYFFDKDTDNKYNEKERDCLACRKKAEAEYIENLNNESSGLVNGKDGFYFNGKFCG